MSVLYLKKMRASLFMSNSFELYADAKEWGEMWVKRHHYLKLE